MAVPLWGLFVATLGLIWLWQRLSKVSRAKERGLKELPGPTGWPYIGNVLELKQHREKQLNKWSDQYGSMYQVKLGRDLFVIISDPKISKELFSTDPMLTGRQQILEFGLYEGERQGLGVFNAEGELWEVHRRFLLRQLRDFGFGKSSMEHLIIEEVNEVVQRYKGTCGQSVKDVRETLRLAVVNSLWQLLSSQRFEHDHPELLKLANNTSQ